MHKAFTIREALSFAWKKLSENFWFLVLLTLAFIVVGALLDKSGSTGPLDILSQFLGALLSYFAVFTFLRLGFKIHKGHKPSWNDIMDVDLHSFGMYILGSIIVTISYLVGFVFLIIPGIIIFIRFSFFSFALVDQKLKPIPAIKQSIALTRGRFWHLLGFGLVLAVINAFGALAFGIGLLITAPLTLLATVHVYEKLKISDKSIQP